MGNKSLLKEITILSSYVTKGNCYISVQTKTVSKLQCVLVVYKCSGWSRMRWTSRWFQITRITKRGGHCLKAIYSNLSELNITTFIKHSISAADKLIETKKPPEDLFISEGHKTSTDSSVRHCLPQLTYWLEWYLVIPRESPGLYWQRWFLFRLLLNN